MNETKTTGRTRTKYGAVRQRQRPTPRAKASDISVPKIADFTTTRKTRKMWITPENQIVPLSTFHYEYFRDPEISKKYGVVFRNEENTRLDALRVGFVRVNYEVNGGHMTIETMRWDRTLRKVVDRLVLDNADAIDLIHAHLLARSGGAEQLGCVSLMALRHGGQPVNRLTLGSWNNFQVTKL